MSSYRIIFAGTPQFAATALAQLIDSPHDIVAVYTQPDRPAGRGLKIIESPVKQLALAHQLPILQPATLKDQSVLEQLQAWQADMMVVAAYGLILPASVLSIPRLGCINIHASLLPRWRGAAPLQRCILAGDTVTGVTIMQMDTGLDTGPMLYQEKYTLHPQETTATLHDQIAQLGAQALLTTLNKLATGQIHPVPQNNNEATYAAKITKEEALINWQQSAVEIERKVRAFNPWPVATTLWEQQNMRIWQAQVLTQRSEAEPGTILHFGKEGIDVSTGDQLLRLLKMQMPGGKILSASEFYNAKHLAPLPKKLT